MKFKVGDVVRLRSGGPMMTVSANDIDSAIRIECQWFDASDLIHTARFKEATLKIESEKKDESSLQAKEAV